MVRRPDEQSVESSGRIERIVGRSRLGDRGWLRRVRDRHRNAGVDPVALEHQRPRRPASHLRPREPLRRHGAVDDDGQGRADVPLRRRRGGRLQRDLRAGQARPQRGGCGVQMESRRAALGLQDRLLEKRVRGRRRTRRPCRRRAGGRWRSRRRVAAGAAGAAEAGRGRPRTRRRRRPGSRSLSSNCRTS